jgi:hypothetical protein
MRQNLFYSKINIVSDYYFVILENAHNFVINFSRIGSKSEFIIEL